MTNFNEYKEILKADVVTIHNLLKHFKKNIIDYDQNGNIFINFKKETKKLPILVAHTDNVLEHKKKNPVFTIDNKTIFCANNVGIGFDDKAGIIAIIELWKELEGQFRIIFTADEESGGWGAKAIEPERYNQAQYIIELDRKGSNDLIKVSGCTRLCSDEFAKKWKDLGFKEATGTYTDVNEFKPNAKNVEMCNLSIGYYNPHTSGEYLNIKEFEKTVERVKKFITENKETVFEDKTKEEDLPSYYNYIPRTNGMVGICDCCGRKNIVDWNEHVGMYLCDDCEEWYNLEKD